LQDQPCGDGRRHVQAVRPGGVVIKLMKKGPPPHQWSAEIASLPDRLKSSSIEELLQVSLAFLQ
jgi:hypothetical protein